MGDICVTCCHITTRCKCVFCAILVADSHCFLHSINRAVFIMDMDCVVSEVGNKEILCTI
jgi:hypothetical protein